MATADLVNHIADTEAQRLSALFAFVDPAFAELAACLGLSPLELVEWLAEPDIADRLSSFTAASESIARLRAIGAQAPALSTARALLNSPDPVEQRRVSTSLLRTSAPARPRSRTLDRQRVPSRPAGRTTHPESAAPAATPGRNAGCRTLETPCADPPPFASDTLARSRPALEAAQPLALAVHAPPEAAPPELDPRSAPILDTLPFLHRRNPPNPVRALLAAVGAPQPSARSP